MGEGFDFISAIMGLLLLMIIIMAIRLFGAWMLRIDEVIKHQKEILSEIKKLTNEHNNE